MNDQSAPDDFSPCTWTSSYQTLCGAMVSANRQGTDDPIFLSRAAFLGIGWRIKIRVVFLCAVVGKQRVLQQRNRRVASWPHCIATPPAPKLFADNNFLR